MRSPRSNQRSDQREPTRRLVIRTAANWFEYDESRRPVDMDYQWKAADVMGQENSDHLAMCEWNGWTPVPPERHPEFFSSLSKPGPEGFIKRRGQILMERARDITEESRADDQFAARNAVATQMVRLGQQVLEGTKAAGVKSSIVRVSEPIDD